MPVPFARHLSRFLVFVLVVSNFIVLFPSNFGKVLAAPVLDVSVSMTEEPLLGGGAQVTINVENTGTTKGYNLSIESLFSSSKTDPDGQITYVSSSEILSSDSLNASTGDRLFEFINIKDLAPTENFSMTINIDTSGDPSWVVGDLIDVAVDVEVNTLPDGTGSTISGSDSASSSLKPIRIVRKNANQSTSELQATGTTTRTYSYTLEVQNNYTNATGSVVLTDTMPDGIEFLGVTSGPALDGGFPSRNNSTGETTLQWTVGTMAPGANSTITYDAGIRYDYYGTDNGGTNRTHDDFTGAPGSLGTPIADKQQLTNTLDLDATYTDGIIGAPCEFGCPVNLSRNESVTASYLTLNKTGNVSNVGVGTVVLYTLTYYASEYYSATNIDVHDLLPDGQTFNNDASPAETSFTNNGDGSTDIYWDDYTIATSGTSVITFSANVDSTWEQVPYTGDDIVSGDGLRNDADLSADWADEVDAGRAGSTTSSVSSHNVQVGFPSISKEVEDPDNPGTWLSSVDATVGDTLTFRVRFNTNDGINPITTNINFGSIIVTDWLTKGLDFTGDLTADIAETYSNAGDFTGPDYNGPANDITIGTLSGLQWDLGDIDAGGWWQAVFDADVVDVAAVADGGVENNLFKMTGTNTFGESYSDRDGVEITYTEPNLVLTKNATNVPTPLVSGSTVEYTLQITNTGNGTAEDVLILDTVADGARVITPSITSIDIDSTPIVLNTDYKFNPAYNSSTGEWYIDLNDTSAPAVETSLAPGEVLTIVYDVVVDGGVGAGATLDNQASVSWNTYDDGSGRVYALTTNDADDNTDSESIDLATVQVDKSASSGPYEIGDTISYTLEFTVPAGAVVYWPEILDDFNRDGITYLTGTAALADISGTPVTAASFDVSTNPDPVFTTGGNNQTLLTWYLNNYIDNTGQATDYVFEVSYDVLYQGIEDNTDWEFGNPLVNDRVRNDAYLSWHYTNEASRPGSLDDSSQSPTQTINIDQPELRVVKTEASTGPYEFGDTITFETVITNIGFNDAYDITWEDTLPTELVSPSLVSIVHSSTGTLTSGTHFLENFGGNPLTIDFDGGTVDTNLDVAETITVTYQVDVGIGAGSGQSLVNTVDVDWASKDGSPAGSRVYDDSPQETAITEDTTTESIDIVEAGIAKVVINPVSADVTIGDLVDYSITVTVPAETTLFSPQIEDIVSTEGMEYVGGSAAVVYVSGDPEVAASISSVTENYTSPATGATFTFNFASDIDNTNAASPTGDTDYVFEVQYQMLVTGLDDSSNWVWDPAIATNTSSNSATLTWNDGVDPHSQNDTANIDIIQPYLVTTKNFATGTTAGGSVVNTTVEIRNNGESTAYEVDFLDTLPSELINPSLVSVTHSTTGSLTSGTHYLENFTGNPVTIDFDGGTVDTNLAVGEFVTIVYSVETISSVGAGASFSNSADADYTSLDGVVANERVYDDSDPLEGTADEDTDTLNVANPVIVKTASSSSATIGEQISFTNTVTIPANTTLYNGTITDTVPDGFTVIGTSTSPVVGTVTVDPEVSGTTPVTWDFGDLSNPAISSITLTINATIDDEYFDTTPLDGLPSSVDADGQDTITNTGVLTWDDANSGGETDSVNDNDSVTIAEPNITVSKGVVPLSAQAGETVTYTVVLTNNGASNAYDFPFQDTYDSDLTNYSLTSITHSGVGGLATPADYLAMTGTNPLTILFTNNFDFAPGDTITIVYTAELNGGVTQGQTLQNTAQINSYSTLDGSVSGERTYAPVNDTATVTAEAPGFVVTKTVTGDADLQRGGTTTFRVQVQNVGDAIAYNVDVSDGLPGTNLEYVNGTTVASWSAGGSSTSDPTGAPGPFLDWDFNATINPGESLIVDFDAIATATAAYGTVTNSATGLGEDGGGSSVPTNSGVTGDTDTDDIDTADIDITNLAFDVDKQLVSSDHYIQYGESAQYEIVITNNGTTVLEEIPLQDVYNTTNLTYVNSSPASNDNTDDGTINWTDITTSLGDLNPGSSHTVTVNFTANNTLLNVPNTAEVAGATDENSDTLPTTNDNDTQLNITNPDLTVTKTLVGSQDDYQLGSTVSFDIIVANTGDTVLTNIPLEDNYDNTVLSFVQASTTSDDLLDDGTINWSDITVALGDLNPGSFHTITVEFNAIATSNNTVNTADVISAIDTNGDNPTDSNDSDSTLSTFDIDDVEIVKTSNPADGTVLLPNDTITYTLTYTNNSNVALDNVEIVDELDDGLSYVSDSMELNGSTTLTDILDADIAEYESGSEKLILTIPSILPTETNYVTFDATVKDLEFSAEGIENSAILNSDEIVDLESNTVMHFVDPIELYKTATDVNGGTLEPGDEILWTIRVENIGISQTINVVITDDIPDYTTYKSGSIAGTGADASGLPTLSWNIGVLPVGGEDTVTFISTVDDDVPDGAVIENQALVTSDNSLPKVSDDTTTASIYGDPTFITVSLASTGADSQMITIIALLLIAIGGYGKLNSEKLSKLSKRYARSINSQRKS